MTLPQVPTYAEAGLPQYDPKNWQGVLVPARTPKAIIAKLSSEIQRILAMPDVAEKLVNSGMDPYYTGPEKMMALMKADYAETAKIIKEAKIKIEE